MMFQPKLYFFTQNIIWNKKILFYDEIEDNILFFEKLQKIVFMYHLYILLSIINNLISKCFKSTY